MKRCPRCNRIYSEDDLNFCLDDGELLQHYADEQPTRPLRDVAEPPTVMLDPPRATDPIGWGPSQPIGQWQGQTVASPQTQFQAYPMAGMPNQMLAIMSLGFGVGSLVIGWCCYIGFLLGPAGIVLGIVSLIQIKNNPQLYAGKPLAWVGIGAGSAFLVLYFFLIVIWGVISVIGPR
jgi:hypothetical protein